MESLFPHALVACIGEGRRPNEQELQIMADKIRREVFPHDLSPMQNCQAMNIARAALFPSCRNRVADGEHPLQAAIISSSRTITP